MPVRGPSVLEADVPEFEATAREWVRVKRVGWVSPARSEPT